MDVTIDTERIESVDGACDILAAITDVLDEKLVFEVHGFDIAWPVDVRTDMLTVLEQLPAVIGALATTERTIVALDFYEQGADRKLVFEGSGMTVKIVCRDLWSEKQHGEEDVDRATLVEMLRTFLSDFVRITESHFPELASRPEFLAWRADADDCKHVQK